MPIRHQHFIAILACFSSLATMIHCGEAPKKIPPVIDVEKADADFAIQGEYAGELKSENGPVKVGVQVIARGHGKFHAELLNGGLPGDGWDKSAKSPFDGATQDGVTTLTGKTGKLVIKDGKLVVSDDKGGELGDLKRVVRESPTLGAKPPAGALVIFDGTNLDQFQKGARMSEDKLLMEGANTLKPLTNYTLHVEFKLPYMPEHMGQQRGNSGCYQQSRYEIQILDSFGLKGENNECGGVYTIKTPDVNMCFPPLSWQTYDIDYTAAIFEAGKKVKNAIVSVKHNGVDIHKNAELPHTTTSAPEKEGPDPKPIHFQNHGNPVRFRNIWVVEKP